ncbi:hypothetical protein [Streptomyces sp. NPDC001770]
MERLCGEDETATILVDGVCEECRTAIDQDGASCATGAVPDTFLARPRREQTRLPGRRTPRGGGPPDDGAGTAPVLSDERARPL